MTVEAVYMGPRQGDNYWVNVRNANPTGMIGDAGVIRRFKSEEEAKTYAKTVNDLKPSSEEEYKLYQDKFEKSKPEPQQPLNIRHEGDEFVKSKEAN